MSLFDGLPDLMTDPDTGFGESVIYTPLSTGIPLGDDGTINGVWVKQPIVVSDLGGSPGASGHLEMVHVQKSDVASPHEGDTVRRVKTDETFSVVPPIGPEDNGLIGLTLQKT